MLPLAGIFSIGEKLIDRLIPDPQAKLEAKIELEKMKQAGDLAQIAVNIEEAKSESLFVSGWRPAIGWTCGLAFAYAYIIHPIGLYLALLGGVDMTGLPEVDIGAMMPVLLGMLGLGYMRTEEKKKGVNKNR